VPGIGAVRCSPWIPSAPKSCSPPSERRSSRRSPKSRRKVPKGDERVEPGDLNSESLYQDELDAGRSQDLKERLAAVERAEARIAAGTYGLSVQSGDAIPDERLEAVPTAELTVEEQEHGARK
jgi:DnaK suppressor protein